MKVIKIAEMTESDFGGFKASVFDETIAVPISNANISITKPNDENFLVTLTTDISGQSPIISLPAPPLRLSENPSEIQPYSEYNVTITADGFSKKTINNVQIYADSTAIQYVYLQPISELPTEEIVNIPPPTIYGDYPEKIPESEVKPLPNESGFVVLDKVVIPEYVIVHDGLPDDDSAPNYYIPYKDYIKNVASSEIYSTWPDAAIRANILAINSFTLNRIFTEWYRSRGKDFTITNSTRYDQFFVYGRNIYEDISVIVDEMFTNYIQREGQIQPLFSQYCDGERVSCPNWLSQWGSKYLAEQGYSTLDILRYYYGNDIFLGTAEKVSGIPSSYPGYPLQLGSSGDDVATIQRQLNSISKNYPSINKVKVDGVFGKDTEKAVLTFQNIFSLPEDGIVGFSTWYQISSVYVSINKLA